MTAKSINKEIHKCEECETTENVHLQIDPYDYEINDCIVKRWLCNDCYNDRKDEI